MAERIVRLRNSIGLDRAKWARKLGVSYQTAFDWEQGKYPPKRENAERIADACGVSVDEVLGRPPPIDARVDAAERLAPGFTAFYAGIGADTTDDEKRRLEGRAWREGLEVTPELLWTIRAGLRTARHKQPGLPPPSDRELQARAKLAELGVAPVDLVGELQAKERGEKASTPTTPKKKPGRPTKSRPKRPKRRP